MIISKGKAVLTVIMLATAPAYADKDAERFITAGMEMVIGELSDSTSPSARKKVFKENLSDLLDIRLIGRFVIGRYGRGLEEEDLDRYLVAFEQYLQAIYYQRIRQYEQSSFLVIGSVDIKPGDTVVKTEIRESKDDKPLRIDWRVRRDKDGGGHKIIDMGLRIDGNQIWLAQEQRSQFTVILEKGNGDIDALIGKMREIYERENRRNH